MLRTTLFLIASSLAIAGCSSSSSSGSPPPPTDPPPQGPDIVKIEVGPAFAELDVGNSQRYQVLAVADDGSVSNVTTDVTLALENDSGIVDIRRNNPNDPDAFRAFAVTPGQDNIVATLGDLASQSTVVVSETTLVSFSVSPETVSLPAGAEEQFTAEGIYDDDHDEDLTEESTWSSSDSNVATISEDGLLNAVAAGTATVTASFDGQSDTATVEVLDPANIVSIAVTPKDVDIPVNAVQQFTATAFYGDGSEQSVTDEVVWSSSNTDVISPNATTAGLFQGISEGNAVITAEFGDNTDTAEVTADLIFISNISILPAPPDPLTIGDEIRFTSFVIDTAGNIFQIDLSSEQEFSVEDTTIAVFSIDPARRGVLTALEVGSTTVRSTFEYAGFTYLAETVVTVIP